MPEQTVSVLGLGIIGSIWAGHYRDAGVLAACWNRTRQPEAGGWMGDPAAAARAAEAVHLCLYDPDSVREVLDRIRPALGPARTVVQSSTIDPESAEEFAAFVRATGAAYVEAPFTGSKPAAIEKKTVFFLGGDRGNLESIDDLLKVISRKRFRFETPRQAATIKLAMNLQISAITEALCEGIAWARKAGLDDGQFFEALRDNVAWSGLAALKEPKIRKGDYSPQFSIKNMSKDMRLAAESAPPGLPALGLVRERLEAAVEAGFGEEDFVALLKLL
ncbi:MAG: NAD(P)-dependent oxidoreductase [Puniceicoccaceae bacterium]